MNQRSIYKLPLVLALLIGLFGVSCSGDKSGSLKERYASYKDRRAMRIKARQEDTDKWFARRMGNAPQNDTGLKLPD